MRNLLQFEFRRLFTRSSLYICMIILLSPMLLNIGILAFMRAEGGGNPTAYDIYSMFFQMGLLPLIVVVFTSIFACEDSTRGTIKTIYALGYPRHELFLAKFLVSAAAAVIMFLEVLLVGGITCLIFASGSDQSISSDMYSLMGSEYQRPDLVTMLLHQFTVILASHAVYFLLAELSNKVGISIALGIFIPGFVGGAIVMGMQILSILFRNQRDIAEGLMKAAMTFQMYWLPSSSVTSMLAQSMGQINYGIACIVNIGYLVLFGGLALLATIKKQIK